MQQVDAGAGEEEIERLLRFFASEEGGALGRRIAERGRQGGQIVKFLICRSLALLA